MTSIIKFTAISGAHDESPPCYLLQVDEFRFLLDCGWNETFGMDIIENIKRHIHQIDAVLLTFPDVMHLGALPYLVGKLGLKCPVYATVPVYKMGQMFMYDLYQSRHNSEDFDLFTLDDVDTAFDLVVQVKYSQTVQLKGKGHGLTITPYAAGHMVGGTMWKIMKDGEEDIVYAIDYNHKKERHLDGAVLESLSRPHLLITDTYNALNVQARRKERDQALLKAQLEEDSDEEMEVDPAAPTSSSLPSSSSSSSSKPPKHDLMMVEEAKARSSFFKQAKSYPMFPFKEEKLKWDDYGEAIRPEDYAVKELVASEEKHETQKMETEEVSDQQIAPTKCMSQKRSVSIRCSLSFIDFEGRSDGESVKRILSIVKPRQLILIHGTPDSTNHLLEFAKKSLGIPHDKISAPMIGGVVDATTESHIYQVKLKDSLMSSISFSRAKDAELAWVDGVVRFNQAKETSGESLTTATGAGAGGSNKALQDRDEASDVPELDALPHDQVTGHKSVFINPPRLTDFKQVLTKAGIQAEFSGGILVCNGRVALRRQTEGGGGIELEGAICEDYYKIRQLLYDHFAII